MAMRAVQNLQISLGMFGFPVKVYKATDDPGEGIGFRQLHKKCGNPINQVKRCQHCAEDVPSVDLLKGYEDQPGTFLKFTDEEIKALKPEAAGTIKIDGYVDGEAIDAAYQDGTVYFLSPDRGDKKKGEVDTFVTFREALAGRWAIGKVVMYGREHVVAIRSVDRMLAMHFIRTHAELRNVSDIPGYTDVPEQARPDYVEMMAQLVAAQRILVEDVVLESDSYTVAVQGLIDARRAGQAAPPAPEAKPVPTGVDLMAMLKASVAAVKEK